MPVVPQGGRWLVVQASARRRMLLSLARSLLDRFSSAAAGFVEMLNSAVDVFIEFELMEDGAVQRRSAMCIGSRTRFLWRLSSRHIWVPFRRTWVRNLLRTSWLRPELLAPCFSKPGRRGSPRALTTPSVARLAKFVPELPD